MKFYLTLIICLFSCLIKGQSDYSKIDLESHWINLTKLGNKYVIYNPCDASNKEIKIDKAKQELFIQWGVEDNTFKILDFNKIDVDNIILKIKYGIFGEDRDTNIYIKYLDKGKKISQWNFTFISGTSEINYEFVMTASSNANKYKIINQPCKECWPEVECDTINKKKDNNSKK